MPRMVYCAKLEREAEGLDRPPYPNELGQRIYESISKDAWRAWLVHSTRIVNENRLDVGSREGVALLLREAEAFFFGDGGTMPAGYTPSSES